MSSIVIWYFYTWNDHNKSSYHLSLYRVITVLLTILPMLYITSLCFNLFYSWKFPPFDSLHLFCPPPASFSENLTDLFPLSLSLFFIYLFFLLTSLGIMSSRIVRVAASASLHSFYGWIAFPCVSPCICPFTRWGALRLSPCPGYCK